MVPVIFLGVLAALAAAGCAASWKESVSPNFKSRDPDAGAGNRIPLGEDVTLVDDGNGTFSMDDKNDYVMDSAGAKLAANDERVQKAFARVGINGAQFNRAPVAALRNYIAVFWSRMADIKKDQDAQSVWSHYEEIAKAADAAGVPRGVDSALAARALDISGKLGCYIPIFMAEQSSGDASVNGVSAAINVAGKCGREQKVKDPEFSKRLKDICKAAIQTLSEKNWTVEDLGTLNEEFKKLGQALDAAGIRNTQGYQAGENGLGNAIGEAFFDCYFRVISSVLVRTDVKEELDVGKVELLQATISTIGGFASQVGLEDKFSGALHDQLIKGYREALAAIKARSGELASASVARERLDALEKSAKEKKIYSELSREFLAARKALNKSGGR